MFVIENDDRLVLIDTGMGTKQSERFFSYYYRWGDHDLLVQLTRLGFLVMKLQMLFLLTFILIIVAAEVFGTKNKTFITLFKKMQNIGAIKSLGLGHKP